MAIGESRPQAREKAFRECDVFSVIQTMMMRHGRPTRQSHMIINGGLPVVQVLCESCLMLTPGRDAIDEEAFGGRKSCDVGNAETVRLRHDRQCRWEKRRTRQPDDQIKCV